ncbi:uncharacterized protein TRIADDRAFT_28167 [Trichoplax adhaerens]|uniref:Xaa-Pro aminopeptidase 1 n=1 Tax=Trichoplax adhaerens TaxID=10228 RepID=B3S3B3_TRIAD|nr:hypothetical protein TRIADDRAFT_28167 [Trichoplax adhaerens]EDV22938.1 hypothetical protein TRIADDRAFT_28167 [Trichoplax adhaerens]|eukprot:XP_002114804.1 hypothetical protein TRIADDRAFT_28167 [Trichoplax adhaerens]
MNNTKNGQLLRTLRSFMANMKHVPHPLQAYIIPTNDAHQSEYLANRDKRREFISGFTGSFGNAIVTRDKAALWTDGRYYLQATEQLDDNWTLMKQGLADTLSMEDWLIQILPKESYVGVDPFLFTHELWKSYSQKLSDAGLSLVAVQDNLVDLVWTSYDRSEVPLSPLMILPLKYSGKSVGDKLKDIRDKMSTANCDALVISALDEVAWLLNIRGADIEYNPVFFAYAIVTANCLYVFTSLERITSEIFNHLKLETESELKFEPYENVLEVIEDISSSNHGQIWISPLSSHALVNVVPKEKRYLKPSPIALMKALKNTTELDGLRNAHIRDAAALCEFYAWLEKEIKINPVTEIGAADVLEDFRKQQDDYISLSFPTISSSGEHGAIIHYCPTEASNREITETDLYLCDSGAQFRDGTTDVTRTIHLGNPTEHEKECFTRVLKGHINLCKAIFPNGTNGHVLDMLARKPLWDVGLDYRHGTGHGVGAFLMVHEGPHGIGSRPRKYDVPLMADMTVTDEPGYYEDGSFGIRIENVVIVKSVETKHNFGGIGFLTFEPITLVPIQKKLLSPELLTEEEVAWINDYHQLCREKVGDLLIQRGRLDALKWLQKETEVIG